MCVDIVISNAFNLNKHFLFLFLFSFLLDFMRVITNLASISILVVKILQLKIFNLDQTMSLIMTNVSRIVSAVQNLVSLLPFKT